MSLQDEIRSAQIRAGEEAVMRNLERLGLVTTMWAVHVRGPDDVIPAPSRAEAEAACVLLNACFERTPALRDLGAHAVVTEWHLGYEAWKAQQGLFGELIGGMATPNVRAKQGPTA